MELIEVECVCSKCKNPFIVRKECHNKLDAEILEDKLSRRRKPVCPACFKKEQALGAVEMAAKMGLPELIGRTEKQISYAFSLRNSYILQHQGEIKTVKKELGKINPTLIAAVAEEYGISEEECIYQACKEMGIHKGYSCLEEVNAQRLIDILTKE